MHIVARSTQIFGLLKVRQCNVAREVGREREESGGKGGRSRNNKEERGEKRGEERGEMFKNSPFHHGCVLRIHRIRNRAPLSRPQGGGAILQLQTQAASQRLGAVKTPVKETIIK